MKKLLHLICLITLTMGILGFENAHAVQFVLDATDSGWYDISGFHDSSNENYAADNTSSVRRNFFVFDLSSVLGNISSATLTLSTGITDPGGLYALHEISTGTGALTTGGSGLTSIYSDLGTGPDYGSLALNTSNVDVDISLNANAIIGLNSALGSPFALGGRLTAPSGGRAFWATGNPSVVRRLTLQTGTSPNPVPEPSTMLLMGSGLIGLVGFNYRRKKRLKKQTT